MHLICFAHTIIKKDIKGLTNGQCGKMQDMLIIYKWRCTDRPAGDRNLPVFHMIECTNETYYLSDCATKKKLYCLKGKFRVRVGMDG